MMNFFGTLEQTEQSFFYQELADQLDKLSLSTDTVVAFFDARNLPCPMPLLKAKITLRSINVNQALYLIATDKNSQTDLLAYCQKNALTAHSWHSDAPDGAATIYHFILLKTV